MQEDDKINDDAAAEGSPDVETDWDWKQDNEN
jgi:hypothetical protein